MRLRAPTALAGPVVGVVAPVAGATCGAIIGPLIGRERWERWERIELPPARVAFVPTRQGPALRVAVAF